MSKINELVNEAVVQWANLVGLCDDPKEWDTHKVQKHLEGLNESRTLDLSGLTTFMMLRGLVEDYLKSVTFDAHSLILNPDAIKSKIAPMKALRDILENPVVVSLISEFETKLRDAIQHYGVVDFAPHEELIKNKFDLAYLRRDALLHIEQIEKHQFIQGQKSSSPLKYNSQIFEFWNINSLLLAMRTQKVPGISVCLIRDPENALHSYFVFAICNGETLTILTDRPDDPHPDFKYITRRPDRSLERRAAQNWFPYQLLDLKEVPDGLSSVLYAQQRTQIVPINVKAVPLKEIRDLPPEQFLWVIFMFDLIQDRFWEQDIKLPELSYTGEMIVNPNTLVGNEGSLVKSGTYQPLEMPTLTKIDVTADSTANQWDGEPVHHNAWMVERYGNQVPNEVFNPVGEQEGILLEASIEKSIGPKLPKEDRNFLLNKKDTSLGLRVLSPSNFGTKEQLQKDRLWVARVNQMKAIQLLADQEHCQTVEKVKEWFEEKILDHIYQFFAFHLFWGC